jgi:hypothetical protein
VDALLETVNKPRHSAKKPGTGGWHVRCTFQRPEPRSIRPVKVPAQSAAFKQPVLVKVPATRSEGGHEEAQSVGGSAARDAAGDGAGSLWR